MRNRSCLMISLAGRSNLVMILALTSLSIAALPINAKAETILYNSNGFEFPTFTAGSSPAGQDASNPWSAIGGSPNAFSVESSMVASGTQAIQANGGGLNDGAFAFPGLFYAPGLNERVDIQVDMARNLSSNVDDSSPVYAIDIYDDGINRTSRFGLQDVDGSIRAFISVPINGQGQIDPNGTGIRSEFYGAAIPQNTFVHFDFTLDYSTKTVTLSMDGTPLAAGVPFFTQSSTDIVAAALEIGTFNNLSSDSGFFDNYTVSAVPYLHGDVNHDGIINGQDLALVSSNWLQTGVAPTGDVNEDGIVNAQDLAVVSSNWLHTLNGTGTNAANTAVPEPGTVTLLIAGVGVIGVFRSRRRARIVR
jgi:hypothetical protein